MALRRILAPARVITLALMASVIPSSAQTLTCTFRFTGSGTIGAQAFTNAAIAVMTTGKTANRQSQPYGYYIADDSVSISISTVGTFQLAIRNFVQR